jgi:predicted nucleic acid-binding Zn ribbon protein
MEKKQAQPIKNIITEILKRQHLDHKMLENRVTRSWEKVIGKNVARATTQIFMNNGTLYLSINSSVMRNELLMLKDKIMDALNKEVGHIVVTAIVIR